jgi:hypothetical protein
MLLFSVRHIKRPFNEKHNFWNFLMKMQWKDINNFESLILQISQPNSYNTRSTQLFQSLSLMFVCLMVFNATFKNISVISWRSVLLVEETEGPGENHRPVASHWQTLSHNGIHLALIEIQTHKHQWVVIGTDCIGSYKSNYHTITAATFPLHLPLSLHYNS